MSVRGDFNMARPLVEVEIDGNKFHAILDTGSWRSYIRAELTKGCPVVSIEPFHVRLGGKAFSIEEGSVIQGIVKDSQNTGYRFGAILFPVDNLGEEEGRKIDILFGALTLEDWGAVIDESIIPPKIDYTRLRKGELVELKEAPFES